MFFVAPSERIVSNKDLGILYFISYQYMFSQTKIIEHSLMKRRSTNKCMSGFFEVLFPPLLTKEAKPDKFPK